jgi:uncharacterized phage protein (TIGR02216 family)
MAAGFGILRLSPQAFWSMTPREFAHAVGWLAPRSGLPARGDLAALMSRFPDAAKPKEQFP